MKAKFLIALCAVALFAISCGDGEAIVPEEPKEPEVPEKVKEPVIEGPLRMKFDMHGKYDELIMLCSYDATYKGHVPVTKVEAEIVGGSGNYKIIYPEEIFCMYWGDESDGTVPYSEKILKVRVKGNIIHVERVLPAYNPNGSGQKLWLEALFIIEDSKGQQKRFWVHTIIVFSA